MASIQSFFNAVSTTITLDDTGNIFLGNAPFDGSNENPVVHDYTRITPGWTASGSANGVIEQVTLFTIDDANWVSLRFASTVVTGGVTLFPPPPPSCFVAGTRILTQNGSKAIENLQSTDNVITADNRFTSFRLKTIQVSKTDSTTAPYCIEPNAFGPNKPAANLCLSPTHKVLLRKGVWISPERAAKTNSKVRQYGIGEPITYYHIACDDYLRDNIIAEGMVTETLATNKNYDGPAQVYTWSDKLGGFTRISYNQATKSMK